MTLQFEPRPALADACLGNEGQRALLDLLPAMVGYWDQDLVCRFANAAYRQWFGIDPNGLIGRTLPDLLGPELWATNQACARAALRGEPQQFERAIPGPAGAVRHSLSHYLPDTVDGRVRGFVAYVTDVSSLHAAREARRQEAALVQRTTEALGRSEAALRQAQRLGRIGSWTWEPESDVTTWSEQLYEIFGLDPQQMPPGRAAHERMFTPSSWSRLDGAVNRALQTGAPWELELVYLRADGHMGWLDSRGMCEHDAEGRLVALHGTAREVSAERRVPEQALRGLDMLAPGGPGRGRAATDDDWAQRLQHPEMRRLYDAWQAAPRPAGCALPALPGLPLNGYRALVFVQALRRPSQAMAGVAADALTDRGADHPAGAGAVADSDSVVPCDNPLYHRLRIDAERCAATQQPAFDEISRAVGPGLPVVFDRLMLPCVRGDANERCVVVMLIFAASRDGLR